MGLLDITLMSMYINEVEVQHLGKVQYQMLNL